MRIRKEERGYLTTFFFFKLHGLNSTMRREKLQLRIEKFHLQEAHTCTIIRSTMTVLGTVYVYMHVAILW